VGAGDKTMGQSRNGNCGVTFDRLQEVWEDCRSVDGRPATDHLIAITICILVSLLWWYFPPRILKFMLRLFFVLASTPFTL
jgi:hypothetical protein